jgi:hypothetical protein
MPDNVTMVVRRRYFAILVRPKCEEPPMMTRIAAALAASLLTTTALAQQATTDAGTLQPADTAHNVGDYSPFVDRTVPDRVLWGDTHLHTSYSADAGFFGNTLDPEKAYRFARGEEVTSSNGTRAQLIRPLDFLVVADHAVYYGLPDLLVKGDPVLQENPVSRRWYSLFNGTPEQSFQAFTEALASVQAGKPEFDTTFMMQTVWDRVVNTAEEFNNPGVFTTINGYEWSTNTNGNNLHRVVMFRDSADRAKQVTPFSAFDSQNVEDLWSYMAAYEDDTGGRVLAIPHNGNWSNGRMFSLTRDNGEEIDTAYAEARQRFEPVYEATQIKGDGEAHPLLSPNDEFADFGTWDKGNIGGVEAKTPDMLPKEYARSALKIGLAQEAKLGVNPFKFGLIGATDAHTSLATAREDNFFGKNPASEPSADRWEHVFMKGATGEDTTYYNWETLASGLAGAWARKNTREAIWDAFKRREVYATTGSRILLRVFGGWDFQPDEVERPDFADRGYAGGVPMGGDLTRAPNGKAPTFMIRALRDPDNANLDRVQVIKGWLGQGGETFERIYDVACSDDRAIVERRCERDVDSTVEGATYTNTIGDPLLTAHWVDPDFDPDERAFYYVRVIEIPKPTWQAYDVAFYGITMSDEVPMTVQDRAYTSPIWYTP